MTEARWQLQPLSVENTGRYILAILLLRHSFSFDLWKEKGSSNEFLLAMTSKFFFGFFGLRADSSEKADKSAAANLKGIGSDCFCTCMLR